MAALCAVTLTAASTTRAQTVECASLPNPIYGIGGSAPNVLLRGVAAALRRTAEPITVVYQSPGACFAMTGLIDNAPLSGTARYWDAAGVEGTCTVPVDQLASWGSMATTAPTCQGVTALPSTVGEYLGPVTGFNIIVNTSSPQQSISSEALYFLYGFGPTGQVSPWTNPAAIGSRSITSAAGLLLAIAAGLPTTRQLFVAGEGGWGVDVGNNNNAVNFVAGIGYPGPLADPNAAIAFASTETVDARRGEAKTLAYQHVDQLTGYLPDSTPTAFDKRNLREGRYYLWANHRFYARVTEGQVTDPATRRFISYITGAAPIPGESFLDVVIDAGNIPECAMNVWRDGDLGALYSFQPAQSCNGYFEERATGSTEHVPCETAVDCTDAAFPVCNFGFCEVQ